MLAKKSIGVLLIMVCASGCYHVTVLTSAAPAGTTVDKQWQNSFVLGLVPPGEVSTKSDCPNGIVRVETERSFVNGLVASLTDDIYTPMHTKITCAAGPGK